jgi:ATP-dependent helicase HrpB
MILAAGRSDDAITLAALLSSGQRLPQGDVIALLDAEQDSHTRNIVQKTRSQLRPAHRRHNDESLRKAVLAGFPDRIGRRHQWSLPREFERIDAEYLVGIDVEERREQARPIVRLACAIEPEWLLDLFPERVRERDSVEWNRSAERVEAVSALLYDDLVIDERRSGSPDPEAAAAMLAAKARDAGWERFADVNEARGFLARAQFAAVHAGVPPPVEEDMYAALAALCTGLRSFGDLEGVARKGGLVRAIRERLPAALRQRLDQIAPEKVTLRGGRSVRVHYSPDQPPWIQSRLQDFFGMSETPAVAGGRVRLVVHLLAPNGRPVQTTTDLAGFWERLYPAVRRELSRRYPKHAWPEIP